ncbi:hypothetical protein C8J57DRAFT_1103525 [Mycena rebaudengoi]|nr:hypothetical protein C8J57DRAFT_1103525 [Mycena rebaudengoi]
MIWSRTWKILQLLGLASQFSKVTDTTPSPSVAVGFDYRRSDRPDGFHWNLVTMPYGCIRFHRAHFLDVFVDHLPKGVAHFGKRLIAYSRNASGLSLQFSDGTSALCDLLVGCDGIKSVVRAQLLRSKAKDEDRPELLNLIEPKWTGSVAYRGLIPSNVLRNAGCVPRALLSPMMYCGQNKHIVSYSISQGNVLNLVAFTSQPDKEDTDYGAEWVSECTKDEVLNCFADWEPEVTQILEHIENPTKWGIHHLRPSLPFFVSERVALLGDAAHGMSPHLGAGAGQAIEDAYILAGILREAAPENLEEALAAYEQTRLPVANHVLASSYESGRMYEFNSKFSEDYDTLGPAIRRQWDFLDESTLEEDVLKALGIFTDLTRERR